MRIDSDALWGAARRLERHDEQLDVLGDEHTLVAYALSLASDTAIDALPLCTFVELSLLSRRIRDSNDWEGFWERRERECTSRATAVALTATAQLLGHAQAGEVAFPSSPDSKVGSTARQLVAGLTGDLTELQRKRVAFACYEWPEPLCVAWWR